MRDFKGKSLLELPSSYTVIDVETTGLDSEYDSLIEVAAIKVENSALVDTYSSLINPGYPIDDFIVQLTGITNNDLSSAPPITNVLQEFIDFIGNDILVGHNVNFDINFLYDNIEEHLKEHLSNDFIDTLRISRRIFKKAPSHKLSVLADYLSIDVDVMHRALYDCNTTNLIYQKLVEHKDDLINSIVPKKNLSAKDISTTNTEFDETHPLYGKLCVFTGALEKMVRKDAMQIVVDLGGQVGNSVTKKTNFLILGNNDYCASIRDGKSEKQKKAEKLKLAGQDIEIISENVFYDMISE